MPARTTNTKGALESICIHKLSNYKATVEYKLLYVLLNLEYWLMMIYKAYFLNGNKYIKDFSFLHMPVYSVYAYVYAVYMSVGPSVRIYMHAHVSTWM